MNVNEAQDSLWGQEVENQKQGREFFQYLGSGLPQILTIKLGSG
jgi:hypothetical protein